MNASSCSQQPPRGHTSMASYGPLKQSLGMLDSSCSQQAPQGHTSMASYGLSEVKPISQPASCSKATSRKHFPAMLRPPVQTSRHLDMNASSCSQQPPRGHTSMASYGPLKQSLGMLHPAANRHPKATHQWLLMGFPRSNPSRSQQAAPRPHRVNIFLPCFVLQFRLPGIWT